MPFFVLLFPPVLFSSFFFLTLHFFFIFIFFQVTKEQFDLYCDIDTTFELCKICDNNVKSIRIDPCGHLLCKQCLSSWMEASRRGETKCPFCRNPV